MLDVWGTAGSDGLEQMEVAPLSWPEVQALTGPQRLVGLPLGYRPSPEASQMRAHAIECATACPSDTTQLLQLQGLCAPQAQDLIVNDGSTATADLASGQGLGSQNLRVATPASSAVVDTAAVGVGWHQPGWSRAQYILA